MSRGTKPAATELPVAPAAGTLLQTQEAAMLGVLGLFTPEALGKMMIEAFAQAFERQMQGKGFQVLVDSLQLAADLRLFKEGLYLTTEQVCRLLDISENTFAKYRDRYAGLIEQDNSLGTHNPRYTLEGVIAARQKLRLLQTEHTLKRRAKVTE